MSIHQSLRLSRAGAGARNVLSRWERVQKLQEQERWKDGDKVLGLPKVRTMKVKIGGKKKAKKAEEPAADAKK